MEEQFPRFQYSYFPHGKDGEQLVIRGSDFTQFALDVESVKNKFNTTPAVVNSPVVATTPAIPAPSSPVKVCPTCGSGLVSGTTKNGKNYEKCSTNTWDRELKKAVGCPYVNWLD